MSATQEVALPFLNLNPRELSSEIRVKNPEAEQEIWLLKLRERTSSSDPYALKTLAQTEILLGLDSSSTINLLEDIASENNNYEIGRGIRFDLAHLFTALGNLTEAYSQLYKANTYKPRIFEDIYCEVGRAMLKSEGPTKRVFDLFTITRLFAGDRLVNHSPYEAERMMEYRALHLTQICKSFEALGPKHTEPLLDEAKGIVDALGYKEGKAEGYKMMVRALSGIKEPKEVLEYIESIRHKFPDDVKNVSFESLYEPIIDSLISRSDYDTAIEVARESFNRNILAETYAKASVYEPALVKANSYKEEALTFVNPSSPVTFKIEESAIRRMGIFVNLIKTSVRLKEDPLPMLENAYKTVAPHGPSVWVTFASALDQTDYYDTTPLYEFILNSQAEIFSNTERAVGGMSNELLDLVEARIVTEEVFTAALNGYRFNIVTKAYEVLDSMEIEHYQTFNSRDQIELIAKYIQALHKIGKVEK